MSNEIVDLTGIVERMKDKLSKPQEVIDLTGEDDIISQPTMDCETDSQVSQLSEEGKMVTKILSFTIRMTDKDWAKYDVEEDISEEINNYLEFSEKGAIVEMKSETVDSHAKVYPIDLSNQTDKDWQTEFLRNNLPGDCLKY